MGFGVKLPEHKFQLCQCNAMWKLGLDQQAILLPSASLFLSVKWGSMLYSPCQVVGIQDFKIREVT